MCHTHYHLPEALRNFHNLCQAPHKFHNSPSSSFPHQGTFNKRLSMALARLALSNLYKRGSSLGGLPPSASSVRSVLASGGGGDGVMRHNLSIRNDESIFKRFMSTSSGGDGKSESKEVAVNEGGVGGGGVRKRLSRLLPWRRRRRSPGLWRRDTDYDFLGGFGNALIQAANDMDRLFEQISPSNLFCHIREKDDHYKLRFEVPGLTKEDLKITVDDGVLRIQGEHKEEGEEGGSEDDEFWSARSYGYYNTSLALPDDAKEDEIKAELKNGVLFVTIPKSGKPRKDVKEVVIH